MSENATIPKREEIAALPRWARVAFAARCARRVLPLLKRAWVKSPAFYELWGTTANAVRAAESATAASDVMTAIRVADATLNDTAANGAAYAAAYAIAVATSGHNIRAEDNDITAAACDAVVHTIYAAHRFKSVPFDVRYDLLTLRNRAAAEKWTDDTPVPPTVFGPMWPFGPPKDWPEENPGDRLKVTVAPPPDATPEQIADFQVRLYGALNKLALANGGAGLKVDSLGRDVPAVAPVGTGV